MVFDKDHLTDPTLLMAEEEVTSIFRRAGIRLLWRNCSLPEPGATGCHQIPGPSQFVVTIVARNQQPAGEVFGVAFLDRDGTGKYADVFFDNIARLHRDTGTDAAMLLGAVTAHEIGHLLLGSHSHSAWGIMSRHWEHDHLSQLARGALLFTSEQAISMQARIQ